MPKYLYQANYVGEGIKGLLKDGGSRRRAVVEQLFTSLGGRVEAFYYAFGETDLFVIADLPDHAAAAAVALTVNSTGAIVTTTTVLMTPEEVDQVAQKAPTYRAPGQ